MNAHSPKYATFDGNAIDLMVEHPGFGPIPFTASRAVSDPLANALFDRALNGDFGSIAPFDGSDPQEMLAERMRGQRNQLLAQLDAMTGNPLRWAEFEDAQKTALATYRQALLDVPQQAGFPDDIQWPVLPEP